MKRLLTVLILSMTAMALLALNLPQTTDVLAQAAPTATTRPTRIRQPKTTPTPEPTATAEPDETDAQAESAELAPVAPGAMTSQIIVFNPDTSGDATVQIDVYDSGGAVAYTATEFISPNGAKIITLPNTLGANFQGNAVISSDKNVQALALAANGNNSARDAYEGARVPSTQLTFPFARHLADDTQNSILAIQNTTAASADVTLTFYNADGTQAHQQNETLDAHAPFYLNTNDIFSGSLYTGTVAIDSTQNIVAALQTRYFKDTSAVRALKASEQDTLIYLPGLERKANAKGAPQNWSEIFVRNNGANAADITIDFFKTDGTSSGTQTATAVPANGMAQFLLNDTAFASLGSAFTGWAKVTSTEPLGVSTFGVISKGKRFSGADGLANLQVNTRYVCGNTARSATENTQLTLLNTEARNAKILVRLFDPNTGAKLAQTTIKLAPNAATTVKFSDALFAAAGSDFHGMTLVQAKGATPPKIIAAVSNPYGSSKLTGTTGYLCSAIP